MNLFFKRIIFFLILFFTFNNVNSQNIFNPENSLKYAQYLYQTNQFSSAAEEFERVVFLFPDSLNFKLKLINSYHKSNQINKSINRTLNFYNTFEKVPSPISDLIPLILLQNNNISTVDSFISINKFISNDLKIEYQIASYLLKDEFILAQNFIKENNLQFQEKYTTLINITKDANAIKYKKSSTALCLSILVPGLGRIYSGNYKDGLISFTLVAVNAWQAYRGFTKQGNKSVYGWAFASLSTGFYLGNQLGSFKAAKTFNSQKKHLVKQNLQDYLQKRDVELFP